MDYTPFKLNCDYHFYVFFEDKCNIYFRSSSDEGLAMELKELMNICRQNLLHTQDLQKQAHDKGVKP